MSAGAHSDNRKQRNQETVLDGQRLVGSRSQLRTYNFLKKKAIQNGILFPEFELRAKSAGKPTARSLNWKKQQQLKRASNGRTPDKSFCELQCHTAHCVHRLDPDDSLETRTPKVIVSKKIVAMSAGSHSHNSEQRNQETVQDGQQPEGSRNQLRAYNFQKKRAIENAIPFHEFELRAKSARMPTARSQNWKKQQLLKQASKGNTPEKSFCELQSHTAHCVHKLVPKKPCYSLGNCTADIMVTKKSSGKPTARSQNWKKQQQLKQAVEPSNPDKPFCKSQFLTADCVHRLVPDDSLETCTPEITVTKKKSEKSTARSQNWKKEQQIKQAVKGKNPDNPFYELQFHTVYCLHRLDPVEAYYNLETHTAENLVCIKSSGKPTATSQSWKKQQQLKPAAEPNCPDEPFRESQSHTAYCLYRLDSDMPCYSLGTRTAVIIVSKKSPGKPTARSQNWKKQQQLKQAAESSNPDKPFCELQSLTAECVHILDPDEPCHNLGSDTADIPVFEKPSRKPRLRSQNWKKKQQSKQAAEGSNLDKPFCEWRSHTADCVHRLDPKKPCYSLGNRTADIMVTKNPLESQQPDLKTGRTNSS